MSKTVYYSTDILLVGRIAGGRGGEEGTQQHHGNCFNCCCIGEPVCVSQTVRFVEREHSNKVAAATSVAAVVLTRGRCVNMKQEEEEAVRFVEKGGEKLATPL